LRVTAYDAAGHVVTLVAELPAPARDAEGRAMLAPYSGPAIRVILDYGPAVGLPVGDRLDQIGRGAVLDLRTL
jgi:hypothetical protein